MQVVPTRVLIFWFRGAAGQGIVEYDPFGTGGLCRKRTVAREPGTQQTEGKQEERPPFSTFVKSMNGKPFGGDWSGRWHLGRDNTGELNLARPEQPGGMNQ